MVHLREVLSELFFPGMPIGSGRKNLRQTLYELRRLIPEVDSRLGSPVPFIESSRERIQLNPLAAISLDTAQLSDALQGRSNEELAEVVGLYRGDFAQNFSLPDNVEFENWLLNRRQFYRAKIQTVLDLLVAKSMRANTYPQAEAYARQLVEIDPLRESSVRQLMEIYAAMGERTKALRLYEQLSTQLADELGAVPETETLFLHDRILIGGEAVQGQSFVIVSSEAKDPTRQTGSTPRVVLPAAPTAFFGRRKEIQDIRALFDDGSARLVTLLGPGGTGKTRLGIESACAMAGNFRDGVFFLSLQSVSRVDEFISAALKSFNFPIYSSDETPAEKLLNYLREKRLLLILDNFEYLADSGGPGVVADLLRQAPGLQLLVTSRARLNVQGEHLYPVPGLDVPSLDAMHDFGEPETIAVEYSAVSLFLDRAQRIQPGFQIDRENLEHVIQICHMVNGFPLGIELAATWTELLSPREIVAEIENNLDFLEAEIQDLPKRQRSFRAVFNYSWKMLQDNERDAMRRLSVFNGVFSAEAARAVSQASLRVLLSLSNKSWLQRTDGELFGFHTLMRHYAREKLTRQVNGEKDARYALSDYYAAFLDAQFDVLRSANQQAALDAIEAEFDNIRVAFQCLIERGQPGEIVDRMLPSLMLFGLARDYLDDIGELCHAGLGPDFDLAAGPDVAQLLLWIFSVWADSRHRTWDVFLAERVEEIWVYVKDNHLEAALGNWFYLVVGIHFHHGRRESIAVLQDEMERLARSVEPWWYAMAAMCLADLMTSNGGKGGLLWIEKAMRILDQGGGAYEQASGMQILADFKAFSGDFQEAQLLLGRALEKAKQIHAEWFLHQLIESRANVFRLEGRHEEAFRCDREIANYYERIGAKRLLYNAIFYESLHHSRYGSLETAFRYRREACEMLDPEAFPLDHAWDCYELGELHRLVGDYDQAMTYFQQAYKVFKQFNIGLGFGFYERGLGYMDFYKGQYMEAMAHFLEMRKFTSDHLWSDSLALMCLGRTTVFLDEWKNAAQYLAEGIALADRIGHMDIKLIGVLGLAELAMQKKDYTKAIRLATLVVRDPRTWNEVREDARAVIHCCTDKLLPADYQKSIEAGGHMALDDIQIDMV